MNISERLEEIAKGCDECAADHDEEATVGSKGEARAWRATAAMIRAIIRDLGGQQVAQ